MTLPRYAGHRPKGAILVAFTILVEFVGIYIALLCLSRDHSPWLWLAVALDACVLAQLLRLQRFASKGIFAAYGGIFFAAAGAWFWFVRSVELTSADWWGLVIALLAIIALARMRK